MHKTDLVNEISSVSGLSKKDAGSALEAALKVITKTLKKGEPVVLIGFGTFKVVKTAEREGRNPQTGKKIKIKASKRAKFSAGKALKDALN